MYLVLIMQYILNYFFCLAAILKYPKIENKKQLITFILDTCNLWERVSDQVLVD